MIVSEKVCIKTLKRKESSEILELVACFPWMVCCRRQRVYGKLNTWRDYLLMELSMKETYSCNQEKVSRRYISDHLQHVRNSVFLLPKEHVQPLILQPICKPDCSALKHFFFWRVSKLQKGKDIYREDKCMYGSQHLQIFRSFVYDCYFCPLEHLN